MANATACPAAPQRWDLATCIVGGSNVCTTSSTTFSCSVAGAGGASKVWVVEDYDAQHIYEAWGDVNGTLFCCVSTTGYTPTEVVVTGSDYGDELRFSWSGAAYNLAPSGSATTRGTIYGGLGNDSVLGSDSSLSTYLDVLYGDSGADSILGGGGDDELYGYDGDDVMGGGAGDDYMEGGAGEDTMTGAAGDDIMLGGADRDYMGGGADDDDMDGGTGGDVMCGDGETGAPYDTLDDGDSDAEFYPDLLWASAPYLDYVICQNNATMYGQSGVTVLSGTCSSTLLTSRPPGCP